MGWRPGDAETRQSRRRVHPRAAGPQGRVCYLIPESGYTVEVGGGCCPSEWPGGGGKRKGRKPPAPILHPLLSTAYHRLTLRPYARESRHVISCDTCKAGHATDMVRNGCQRKLAKLKRTGHERRLSPSLKKALQISVKKFLKSPYTDFPT